MAEPERSDAAMLISDAQKEAGDWQSKVRMGMATLKRGNVDTGLQRRVLSYLSVAEDNSLRTCSVESGLRAFQQSSV